MIIEGILREAFIIEESVLLIKKSKLQFFQGGFGPGKTENRDAPLPHACHQTVFHGPLRQMSPYQ